MPLDNGFLNFCLLLGVSLAGAWFVAALGSHLLRDQ